MGCDRAFAFQFKERGMEVCINDFRTGRRDYVPSVAAITQKEMR